MFSPASFGWRRWGHIANQKTQVGAIHALVYLWFFIMISWFALHPSPRTTQKSLFTIRSSVSTISPRQGINLSQKLLQWLRAYFHVRILHLSKEHDFVKCAFTSVFRCENTLRDSVQVWGCTFILTFLINYGIFWKGGCKVNQMVTLQLSGPVWH